MPVYETPWNLKLDRLIHKLHVRERPESSISVSSPGSLLHRKYLLHIAREKEALVLRSKPIGDKLQASVPGIIGCAP